MRTITQLTDLLRIPLHERHEWYIPESLSTTVPITDCGEPLVELASFCEQEGVLVLYKKRPQYLRRSAAERLAAAARSITDISGGAYALLVYDAFRPLDEQRKQFNAIKADIAAREGLSGDALWERVTQFIADPDLCPPHSTGGAVDCTLVNRSTGEELLMGTPVDTIDDRANTWHADIAGAEKENRKMLFSAMTQAGFVNLASEWWHYSYGDQYWAAFQEQPHALYGSIAALPA